jgi:predicted component of type VI protein secretion system
MKRTILMLFFTAVTVTACNSEKKIDAKEDSIEAAAAADSMLNEALKADSLNSDSDSLNSDTDSI